MPELVMLNGALVSVGMFITDDKGRVFRIVSLHGDNAKIRPATLWERTWYSFVRWYYRYKVWKWKRHFNRWAS